jgi:hypothetical protein
MFYRDASGQARCRTCGAAITRGSVYFQREGVSERGYANWYQHHPMCALEGGLDDIAAALKQSTLAFAGRAELEAEVQERLARSRVKPLMNERELSSENAGPTAVSLAEESRMAKRPVHAVGLVVHEQWAAGRMLQSMREALGGLHLRTANNGYGFASYGDELPDLDVVELQKTVRAFVLYVSTAGSTMAPMKRALWGVRASGLPVVALWLVGDAPMPSPARDRREQEVREALDALGLDADLPPVVHAQRVDSAALRALGEGLDEAFSRGVPEPEHPADVAVRSFHWFADERRWSEASRSLDTALRRNGAKGLRPSIVKAAVRALDAEEVPMLALQILARAQDPSTTDALWAFLQAIWQPGAPPGPTVVFVCELLAELGDARYESVAWDGYVHSMGALREDIEALLAKFGGGGDLVKAIEQRIAQQSAPESIEPLRALLARVKRRAKKRSPGEGRS